MAKHGLEAQYFRNWIDDSITVEGMLGTILSEFVIGTPAYNISRKGRDLFLFYNLNMMSKYQALKDELIKDLDFKSFEKYELLKDALINNPQVLFNVIPDTLEEAIYMYIGNITDNKFYKNYFKTTAGEETTEKKKTREEITACASLKRSVVETERIFAHVRNGVAHGCFAICRKGTEAFYIIQDETPDGVISARIIISEKRLERWLVLLENTKDNDTHNN